MNDAYHRPHKTMTPEEYAAMPIVGWHEVCRNVDGFENVGVRFLGEPEADPVGDGLTELKGLANEEGRAAAEAKRERYR